MVYALSVHNVWARTNSFFFPSYSRCSLWFSVNFSAKKKIISRTRIRVIWLKNDKTYNTSSQPRTQHDRFICCNISCTSMCHASNHYDFDSYGSQKYYAEFSFWSQLHRLCILHIYFVVVVFLFLMKNLHQSALILWVNNFRSRFQVRVVFLKAFALLKVKNGRYANCTVRTIGIIINLVFQFELTLTFNTCDQWAHFTIYMEFSMKISQKCFQIE